MKRSLILLLIVVVCMVSACTPAKTEGKLVVAVPQDPDFLDPHRAQASGTEEMLFNIFEGLMKGDSEGNIQHALADSHNVSEDGLIYRFHLRPNVKFHNGKTVTMEDVLYSYKRLKGEEGKPLSKAFAEVDIKAEGEEIIFTLPQANAGFMEEMTRAVIPAGMKDEEHNSKPIGTGPYQFVSYEPTQSLKMVLFEDYWNKDRAGKIKDVEFRIFPDNNTAFTSLMAGEVDILPRISTKQAQSLSGDFKLVEGPQNLVQILGLNLKDEALKDLRVRQALAYAIDKEELKKLVADGKATLLGSNMSPVMSRWFEKGLDNLYPYNPDKAKELLKEAGKEGMTLKITVPSNYDFHVKTAEVIVERLKAVGVNASIELIEWGTWLEQVYKQRQYQSTVIAFTGKLDAHPVLQRYDTDYPTNFFNYSNARVDELLRSAKLEQDQEKRFQSYAEVQKILAEELPSVYLMDPNYQVAIKKNIQGFVIYPIYVLDIAALSFQ